MIRFAEPDIVAETRADGEILLRSRQPLGEYPAKLAASLRTWADADPGHPLIAQRGADGAWETLSYGEVRRRADVVGQALLDRGLGAGAPLVILSGNSIAHFVLTMGALTAGVPVAPVSVAYSLQSHDHARLKAVAELVRPGMVYADDGESFAPALAVVGAKGNPAVVVAAGRDAVPGAESLDDLLAARPGPALEAAYDAITPDTLAKILFTSGSTGAPKGVLNTNRMLCSNQQAIRQAWPFLQDGREGRPVLVDWLPWSHTFGGNHNMDLALYNGGTLYIDDGRPAPGLFDRSVANLRDVRPTVYFNVPAGYAQLVPALEEDRAFAEAFFSRLRFVFNAAAALPAATRARLEAVAASVTEEPVPVTGSWGATETAPAVTSAHFPFSDARCIGVPLPGLEVKLTPVEDAYEIRVRGPGVTPGYFERPDLTEQVFDAEGFYRSGDAVTLADPADVNQGLVFRGRIAEDFKLDTGTFVRVGAVRTALLSAVPLLSDVVLAGENRSYLTALGWLNRAEAGDLAPSDETTVDGCLADPALCEEVARLLAAHNADVGSAARVERLVLLAEPPQLDAGEITDKGYVNQRRVLDRRADVVELLYREPVSTPVIAGS